MSFLPIILKVISEQPQIGGGGGSRSIISDSLRFPWTVAHQATLFMEFSRREYWSGLPFPPPGDLSDPEIEAASLVSPALAGGFFTTLLPVFYN